MRKAIVIGAGFGGIAAAVRLKKKGYEAEIVDRCNNLEAELTLIKSLSMMPAHYNYSSFSV